MKKRTAFSLFELSIVAVIIGILTTGVIQGSNLIKSARINSARLLTSTSPVPQINGLVAWYETSMRNSFLESESYDTAQPTTWYDISPNSVNVQNSVSKRNTLTRTASSSAVYRSSGINKFPALQFYTGFGTVFSLSSLYQGKLAQSTIFFVFRPQVVVGTTTLYLMKSYSGGTTAIGVNSNSVTLNAGTSAATGTSTNAANISYNKDYILAAYFNGSSSAVYVNDVTNLIGGTTINPGTDSVDGLKIGAATIGPTDTGLSGFLSEVIIYDHPLNLRERKDIMGYLSKKYRISVSNL